MKYEITQEDLQTMERDLRTDRTLKHLKNLSFYKFTIGDVLVREEKCHKRDSEGYEWKTKLAECGIPNKYVYVFENDLGVGYIRRLSVNGRKFVDRPTCVTEFDPDQTRFVLDPEYADHMIFSDENAEFDAKSRYDEIKKKREQIHRKNKKLRIPLDTPEQAYAWLQTIKLGDQIYWGYGISSLNKDVYLIQEIKIDAIRERSFIKVVNANAPNSYGYTISFHSLTRYPIFTQRPTFADEIIN